MANRLPKVYIVSQVNRPGKYRVPDEEVRLADRINANISQLLQRFENIMATATV